MVSAILVTVLAFQNAPPRTANGLRVTSNDKTTPESTAKSLSPEMRGDIFMARKMYREAIDAYQSGAKDSALLANKTGIAYHQLLDFASAKKFYERAIKLNSKYAEAINNLGTIYYTEKSYRRAVNEYKKALIFQPDSASFWSNLCVAYFARKNYEEAGKAGQKALELDPGVFQHRGTGGVVVQQLSVEDRARWHYALAKAYAVQGQNDLAIQTIRQALEEGFKDKDKFQKEPEFAGLQNLEEFKKLMNQEQKVL